MTASGQHTVRVGESVTELIDGHAARADSPGFVRTRAAMHKILATGPAVAELYRIGPDSAVEAHHGSSLWVYDGQAWSLFIGLAGIEWSAQWCASPERVDLLRQTAARLYARFPETFAALAALGYPDAEAILSTPITDAAGVAVWTDSIFNAAQPLPKANHTGRVRPDTPLAAGIHNVPLPMVALPVFMRPDFVPFLVDAKTGKVAVVAPVAPRGSGDGRVRVLYAEPGHPLAKKRAKAVAAGEALVLAPDHPLATQAFAQQA